MNPTILTTIISSFLSTIVFPWLESKIGLKLDSTQQGLVTGGLVGAATGAAHFIHLRFAPSPTTGTATTTKTSMLLIGLALIGAASTSGLMGCASTQAFLNSPSGQATVTAVVDVAVSTAEQKGVSAATINSIAKQALAADSNTTASLSAIAGVINARIAKLPTLDQQAVIILETALTAAIVAKVGDNANLAQAQADVAQILNAVITATGG